MTILAIAIGIGPPIEDTDTQKVGAEALRTRTTAGRR